MLDIVPCRTNPSLIGLTVSLLIHNSGDFAPAAYSSLRNNPWGLITIITLFSGISSLVLWPIQSSTSIWPLKGSFLTKPRWQQAGFAGRTTGWRPAQCGWDQSVIYHGICCFLVIHPSTQGLKRPKLYLISCKENFHFTMKKFRRPSCLSTNEMSPLINASARPKSPSVASCKRTNEPH